MCTHVLHLCVCVRMSVCVFTGVYLCVYAYIHVCVCVCTRVCVHQGGRGKGKQPSMKDNFIVWSSETVCV